MIHLMYFSWMYSGYVTIFDNFLQHNDVVVRILDYLTRNQYHLIVIRLQVHVFIKEWVSTFLDVYFCSKITKYDPFYFIFLVFLWQQFFFYKESCEFSQNAVSRHLRFFFSLLNNIEIQLMSTKAIYHGLM